VTRLEPKVWSANLWQAPFTQQLDIVLVLDNEATRLTTPPTNPDNIRWIGDVSVILWAGDFVLMLNQKLSKLVEAKNFAFIATVGRDGYPTVTPVWIDHDGEHLLVNTTNIRAKTRNVKTNPKVSVAVVDWSNPYDKVVVKGRVVEVSENGADEHIDKLAKKYLGQDKYPWHNPKEKRVIIKIKPEKVLE